MKLLLSIIGVVVLTLVNVFVQSFALSTIWDWFVAPQYGAGPSFPAWYGISMVVGILVGKTIYAADLAPRDKEDESATTTALVRTAVLTCAYGIALGMTWASGQVMGWL